MLNEKQVIDVQNDKMSDYEKFIKVLDDIKITYHADIVPEYKRVNIYDNISSKMFLFDNITGKHRP